MTPKHTAHEVHTHQDSVLQCAFSARVPRFLRLNYEKIPPAPTEKDAKTNKNTKFSKSRTQKLIAPSVRTPCFKRCCETHEIRVSKSVILESFENIMRTYLENR